MVGRKCIRRTAGKVTSLSELDEILEDRPPKKAPRKRKYDDNNLDDDWDEDEDEDEEIVLVRFLDDFGDGLSKKRYPYKERIGCDIDEWVVVKVADKEKVVLVVATEYDCMDDEKPPNRFEQKSTKEVIRYANDREEREANERRNS